MARLKELSTLQVALMVSLAVHAALLTVRFVDPESFNRIFEDTPLEVVLVNASSKEVPEKAQVIAQRNLAGGGDVEKGRATSPLPPMAVTEVGEAVEESHKQIEELQQQQMQMLAQLRRDLALLPQPDPRKDQGDPQESEREERRRQLLQLLAQIEKRINEENARPKRRYVSPSAREGVHALYYDALRRKIEDNGTRNFPEANGRKLYGELTMLVAVDARGQVVETEIVQSSGNRTLDRRAIAIVGSAAPFGPFSPQMRAQFDQLVFASRFRFTRDEALRTSVEASPSR
jgi:protein TonB